MKMSLPMSVLPRKPLPRKAEALNDHIFSTIHFPFYFKFIVFKGISLVAQMVKNLPANSGDLDLIPGSGSFPREGNGNPLQYSCQENPMDRGTWQAIVYGVTKSRTALSN